MTASRNPTSTNAAVTNTACPPRRSCVAGAARRRGQACTSRHEPANRLRRIATALRFNLMVDDYDMINTVTRTTR